MISRTITYISISYLSPVVLYLAYVFEPYAPGGKKLCLGENSSFTELNLTKKLRI